MKCRNAKLFGVVLADDSDRIYIAVAIHDGREQSDSLSVRFPLLATSAQGTDESVNYSGSSRSEKGASNFLSANLERQLHFQLRTLASIVPNQESRSKGSFKSSWFWGRQCLLMADRVSNL